MDKPKVLILGGDNCGIGKAVIAILKQMEQQIIIVDNLAGLPNLSQLHELVAPRRIDLGFNQTNFTPEPEYGWYQCFNKQNKRKNLKNKKM